MAIINGETTDLQATRGLLLKNTLLSLCSFMAGTFVVALAIRVEMELGWSFVASAVASLAAIFAFVLYLLPFHPHRKFGYANIVTAFRASLVSLTAAAVISFESFHHVDAVLWVLVGGVAVALALDGIDGYLARKYRQESQLGARFDMEVDAYLILILSVAAAMLDKAGAWVLLVGLMRYGFVAIGWLLPSLQGELPPSMRRKVICVVQGVSLCFILMPWIDPPLSEIVAGLALGSLIFSFLVDAAYLLTSRVQE
ncbi:CDP-alcohol phosphatidyltransferase family protein [Agrobacterium larrymoorei]|uniref:CDP-alcohol phosphatidyltransferase family protein n=1 Tax=Agrobacterium larrymoorei TaxID=160699 RepID=UPI00157321B1|nr:CDP-alcohol phosphatidyltransferase family protein [Agrobacterium larrymoorei]NTJ43919.1 CDP-alcohol phosphatidyltransferase family protein [Agrobacterium larrymoorei]